MTEPGTSFSAPLRWSVAFAGTLAAAIGGLWLLSWFLVPSSPGSALGSFDMKSNMALGLLVAGLASLLLRQEKPGFWQGVAGTAAAALLLLIGLLTFFEDMVGWDLGIEHLLSLTPPDGNPAASPNRMGLYGSTSLALLGGGLLATASRRKAVAPYFGIGVCLINLVPATGFLFGIGPFYKEDLTAIAWPAVLALLLLGFAMVLAHGNSSPMALLLRDDAGGRLLRQLLPAALLIPLVLGYLVVQGEHRGLYTTSIGSGLLVIALAVIFSALLWRSATGLSRSALAHREAETRLIQSEEALRQANEELERRVQERTAELEATVTTLRMEVSRRTVAEELLRERSKLLEAFFQHSATPLVFLDPGFNFIRVNEAYARACARDVSDFPGRNHFELYPSDARAIFEEVVRTRQSYQATARPFSFPNHPEWGVSYWDWMLTPLLNEEGEVESLVFALEDVTKRVQAEESLLMSVQKERDARQFAESIVQTIREPLLVLDATLRVISANNAFYQLFRVASAETQGRLIYNLGNRQWDIPVLRRLLEDIVPQSARFEDYEVECFIEPIGRRTMLLNARRIQSEGLQAPMVLLVIEDITDRKQGQAELKKANEALAARADQLRRLASELTLAEQRERRRMARVLHDHLQQILVAAKFRIATLARSGDDASKQAALGVEDLLNQSIEVSRSLSSELSPPILHDAGLGAGIEWLARLMSDRHGLTITVAHEEGASPAAKDVRILLFESVRELLFNVVKHAGVPAVEVKLQCTGDDQVQIVVSDKGSGFDSSAATSDGYGLLSIQERLNLIGGRMEIDSRPREGTRVTLLAPLGDAPITGRRPLSPDKRDAEKPGLGIQQEQACPGAKIRVLLADDHAVMRQGLARLVETEPDMEVIGEAADGEMAVEMAEQLHPDVVLMDLSMPKVNGIEATRRIHERLPLIQVIGLSMFREDELAESMLDAGAVVFLSKSEPAELVIQAIRSFARHDRPR